MVSIPFHIILRLTLWIFIGCLFTGVLSHVRDASAETNTLASGLDKSALLKSKDAAWNISADTLSYDQEKQIYTAEGNVRVTSGDRSLEADRAVLDSLKQEADLRGHVRLHYGKDWLEGEHVVWNLKDETGSVDDGMVYFSANNFYVHGKSINKMGPTEYKLRQGFITSCDPYKPDWKVRYGQMNVNLDGIAWARDTSFWVRGLPLFYTPIVALPIQLERQSGFLMPWAGASDLQGVEGEVPYYWAIREDMDATFYGHYMTERGWMSGLEYRIANTTWGEGLFQFNYLRDQASKEHLASLGYPYQTADRYWLRSRYTFEMPHDIEGRMDLDFASDRNYLKEFEKGSTSYDFSNKAFQRFSGRGILNDETILTRESSLYMDQRNESTLLGLDVRYWQQLDTSLNEFTLQKLPTFSFNAVPSPVLQTPLYYSLESSWTNYWRQEGDRGNRLDVAPRLAYPLHWKSYLDVEPSVGVLANTYWMDWQEEDNRDAWQGRMYSDMQLAVSSRLNRVYPLKMGDYVAFQHSMRPEVAYQYIPKGVGQNDVAQFDLVDADQSIHEVRYGVTNFFTSKSIAKDAEGNNRTTYHEFARVQLFQAFNLDENDPNLSSEYAKTEGVSSVGMRLDLMPQKYIMLTYDTDFYSTENTDASHDLMMTLDSGRGHILRLNYQFRQDYPIDELIAESSLKLLSNVYFSTYHDYSLDKEELYKQGYGLRYIHGCWGLGLTYEKEQNDQRVALSVNLMGLGSLGGSFNAGPEMPF